ncbi:MAG: 2Fe-2S iron-sulfur cluster-binding protein [Fimbriimonadaceae bacterium]
MNEVELTVEGFGSYQVPVGKKLVKAIEDNGIDISHRCGGLARCTTCRVEFLSEEPPMGLPEKECLEEDGVLGEFRLSCQIRLEEPAKVKVLMLASVQEWEPGPEVED